MPGMDPDRQTGALLIAASIVAAIRLRDEPINPRYRPLTPAFHQNRSPYTPIDLH